MSEHTTLGLYRMHQITRIAAAIEQRLDELERTPVNRIAEWEFGQAKIKGMRSFSEAAGCAGAVSKALR